MNPTDVAETESAQELREIENQFRMAIRDAVNRTTRKPFYWGGLKGYRQLESIAQLSITHKLGFSVNGDEPSVGQILKSLPSAPDRGNTGFAI